MNNCRCSTSHARVAPPAAVHTCLKLVTLQTASRALPRPGWMLHVSHVSTKSEKKLVFFVVHKAYSRHLKATLTVDLLIQIAILPCFFMFSTLDSPDSTSGGDPEVDANGITNTESAAFQQSYSNWAITLDTSNLYQAQRWDKKHRIFFWNVQTCSRQPFHCFCWCFGIADKYI